MRGPTDPQIRVRLLDHVESVELLDKGRERLRNFPNILLGFYNDLKRIVMNVVFFQFKNGFVKFFKLRMESTLPN